MLVDSILIPYSTAPASPSVSRFTRCFDTPSKIPLATAAVSPAPLAPLEARFGTSHFQPRPATPLRRAATKSMGNLAGVTRAQAAQEWADATQSTLPSSSASHAAAAHIYR